MNCCGNPDPLSPTPSNSSDIKTPENTEEDPNAPQPAAEGDIQMEYSSDWLYNPSIGTVPTNYLQELRSGHVPSDNKFDNLAPASWINESLLYLKNVWKLQPSSLLTVICIIPFW